MSTLMVRSVGTTGVHAYLEQVATQMGEALPDDVQVTFDLHGEGGGVWTLSRQADGTRVRPGRGLWADTVLTCTVQRFVELVTGGVDMRQAFFDGTVRVEGDVGLLVRLHRALPQAV